MATGQIITDDNAIRDILSESQTIAIVGLSPKPERDSHRVARYLLARGYTIIPVRPAQEEILGEKVVPSLDDIDSPVDIIDVFRNSAHIPPIAEQALRLRPRVFWMQLGVENREAAEMLTASGIDVIMNRCIKVDYGRLLP